MIASPKYLSLLILFVLPPLFYFRGDVSQRFLHPTTPKPDSQSQWADNVLHKNNASSFEHDGVFDETSEGAPTIVQVSMQFGDNYDEMAERGLRTHITNGEKWGYPTHYLRRDIVGKGEIAEGVYDKLLYLQTIMVNEMTKPFGKRASWIVWFDADTVLLNNNIPWSIFLPPNEGMWRDINMLVTKDWSGFNAGVFLIRVCEWSVNVLSDSIALPRLRSDIELVFREQGALEWVFNEPQNMGRRLYVPRHWFNAYDNFYNERQKDEEPMNGGIIVHFPGMGSGRTDAMGRWLDTLEHNPQELQLPLANTSYPVEIEAYWARLKSAEEVLRKANEYKEKTKEDHRNVWEDRGKNVQEGLNIAQDELHATIQEDAYDKEKLLEAVTAVDNAMRLTTKMIDEIEKEEEAAWKKKVEAEEKKERERKEKEEQERKEKEEQERKAKEQDKKQGQFEEKEAAKQ